MITALGKTVYILGAGCSRDYGYPLAAGFIGGLVNYRRHLESVPEANQLTHCLDRTIQLIAKCRQHYPEEYGEITTLDRLAKWIEEKYKESPNKALPRLIKASEWPFTGERVSNSDTLDRIAQKQILDAKLATSAFFLHLEDEVFSERKTLDGYRRLLENIFGTDADCSKLDASESCVLTFNYDRLFEIAFSRFFNGTDLKQSYCYSKAGLNSGFDEKPCYSIDFQ